MARLWTVTDKNGFEKYYYIQFYSNDTKYPIGKSIAAQILGAYHLETVAFDEKSSNEFRDLKVQADEIDGQNAYLIYHGSSKEKDAAYRLRFTEKGQDIFIDPDFVYFLQNTCRLVPAHPKDLGIESRTVKAYSIRPKSSSCIKTV